VSTETRRAATYPEGYPRGWYALATSKSLREKPVAAEALGRRFALFRDAGGKPRALDAYCPHMGADLSDGTVKDGCLRCPFHDWAFEPGGRLVDVPYSKTKLPKLTQPSVPTQELDGLVFGWHGSARPDYPLPAIEDRDVLHYRGSHDAGVVQMHLMEFAENSVDFAHFPHLHGEMAVPWVGLKVPGVTIDHEARWETHDEPWRASFHDRAILRFRGRLLPKTEANARIAFLGPGGVVRFRFLLPKLGRIVMVQTHTPEAPLRLRTRFRWFAESSIPRPIVSYVVGNWIAQWRRDVRIWERKIHRERPVLVREDGPVHRLRKWYAQFTETPAAQPVLRS